MIRKLLFTAAAAYVGKKIMDSQRRPSASKWTRPTNKANEPGSIGNVASNVGGHQATDLLTERHPGPQDRAPEAFRPDPTAPVSAEDRESMRPATMPVELRNE